MRTLRLFRGIAVPASSKADTIKEIIETGLTKEKREWCIKEGRGLPLDPLFRKVDLSTVDTRQESLNRRVVCCCGTVEGAAYYAWHHNRTPENDTPILIEFHHTLDDVGVDGKDFLYTAFQIGVPSKARDVLVQVFGRKVLKYAEAAWDCDDNDRRIAFCDLAVLDPEVVTSHYENRTTILGRGGTTFESAFNVSLPVLPESIVRVWSPTSRHNRQNPSITISDIR